MLIQPIANQFNYKNYQQQKVNKNTGFKGELGTKVLTEIAASATQDSSRIKDVLKKLGIGAMGLVSISTLQDILESVFEKKADLEKELKSQRQAIFADLKSKQEELEIQRQAFEEDKKTNEEKLNKKQEELAKKEQTLINSESIINSAIEDKINELNDQKAEYEKQNEALNNIMKNYQDILAEDIAYERETLESGFRTLYNIKSDKLPENMSFCEQLAYVTDILTKRRNKLYATSSNTPIRITKALQDNNGRISEDDLKFLERVFDISIRECKEQDLIDAIESVKDNHGLLDMNAATFFLSNLAWAGNCSIRTVIENVGKYGMNEKK